MQPASLNIRLQMDPAAHGASDIQKGHDACHPAVWSCGLHPAAWGSHGVVIRPSRYAFASAAVFTGHELPGRRGWALIEFEANISWMFDGALHDVLLVIPPEGYQFHRVHATNLQVLHQSASVGQLAIAETVSLAETAHLEEPSEYLLVSNLHVNLSAGQRYFINISFSLPDTGLEPSLMDPTEQESGRSACTNAWGISLKSDNEHVFSTFLPAQPLAYLTQFWLECSSRAFGSDNVLTFHFVTGLLPKSSGYLLLLLSLPSWFELASPAVLADFAAPYEHNRSRDPPIFGSAAPEPPPFQKLGCPPIFAHSRGRRLRTSVAGCALYFNDLEDTMDLALAVRPLHAACTHQVVVQVRNPSTTPGESRQHPFRLSIFAMATGLLLERLAVPVDTDRFGQVRRLQAPLQAAGCEYLAPAMQAEVIASSCPTLGHNTEVTLGFVAPEMMALPVRVKVSAPVGYLFTQACSFNRSWALPAGRAFDDIGEEAMSDCIVSPDGRVASFAISQVLRPKVVWSYFTIHLLNPGVMEQPAVQVQSLFSLEMHKFAAGSATGVQGLSAPSLRAMTDLDLLELPFTYNATSWPLLLRLRTATRVPAGGSILLHAPFPFSFPAEQCRGENTSHAERIGSPHFVPALPAQPFQPIREVSAATTPIQGADSAEALLPRQPTSAFCSVGEHGQFLAITILEGELPVGLYELRFAVLADPEWEDSLVKDETRESAVAPLLWIAESWRPAPAEPCSGGCCPERRPNFEVIVGLMELELLDRGAVEAYPTGAFRHRRVVSTDYGGWRFSDDDPGRSSPP